MAVLRDHTPLVTDFQRFPPEVQAVVSQEVERRHSMVNDGTATIRHQGQRLFPSYQERNLGLAVAAARTILGERFDQGVIAGLAIGTLPIEIQGRAVRARRS